MKKHIPDFKNWNPRQNSFDLKKGESVHRNDKIEMFVCGWLHICPMLKLFLHYIEMFA